MSDSMLNALEGIDPDRANRNGWALVWALFLGVSWTWCIGMFLPVLLVRDYGRLAWVIFAVPNCLGAAVMGWTLRDAGASRAFVRRHQRACEAFSLVTMAFQIFFATWMLPRLVGPAGYVGAAVLIQAAFTPIRSPKFALTAAGTVYVVSLAIAATMWFDGSLISPEPSHATRADLLGLAGVCLLGFIFSPYLDLTFHQARQATGVNGGRVAFAVGFCVIFASMIVLSLFYAEMFNAFLALQIRSLATTLIAIHLAVQMAFTVNAHAAALRLPTDSDSLGRPVLALTVACAFAAGLAGHLDFSFHNLAIGEVIYRCFLVFYGLLVPAYLLSARGRRPLMLFAITVVLALPSLWLAFIHRDMKWAMAATAVVVTAGIVANAQPPREELPAA